MIIETRPPSGTSRHFSLSRPRPPGAFLGVSEMDDHSKSRTQLKKEDKALQKLGESLVALPADQLGAMDMPDELREAIDLARTISSRGARRRQLKYIGKIMREIDCDPIRESLHNIRQGDLESIRAFKQIEYWRDELKAGNQQILEEIVRRCPKADRQRLSRLASSARADGETDGDAKSSRQLFRYLKDIAEF